MDDLFTLAARRADAEIELGKMVELARPEVESFERAIERYQEAIHLHRVAIATLDQPVDAKRAEIAALDAQLLAVYDATVPPEHEGPVYGPGGIVVTVRKPSGKASVVIDAHHEKHPEDLPEGCFKPLFEPLKNKIYARLSKGEVIEGCSLKPGERSVSVEVRSVE